MQVYVLVNLCIRVHLCLCVCMDECVTVVPMRFIFHMFVHVCVRECGW